MTKQAFERHLNEVVGPEHGGNNGWGNGSGARTRPYGTWLRAADKEQFDDLHAGNHLGTPCTDPACAIHLDPS